MTEHKLRNPYLLQIQNIPFHVSLQDDADISFLKVNASRFFELTDVLRKRIAALGS
jgi:hypothetical protein